MENAHLKETFVKYENCKEKKEREVVIYKTSEEASNAKHEKAKRSIQNVDLSKLKRPQKA